MSLLYLTCSRISEITRANVRAGKGLSVKKNQFITVEPFIMVRNIPIYKRSYILRGGKWSKIKNINEYPNRIELPLPLKGDLSRFTSKIQNYLDQLEPEEELFKFKRARAFQIINHVTGEFPHYFRSMGLKMWLRLFHNDLIRLQQFSSHIRLPDLKRYLSTTWTESTYEILNFKMQDTRTNHDE